jgi:hypothetical protein
MKKLISRITASDFFLITLFMVLGILSFGWIIYPPLGAIWSFINGGIFLGILITAICVGISRKIRRKNPYREHKLSHK